MKILAKLLGRVNVFNPSPDFSYVTLKNINNGEVIDSNAVTEKLVQAGITQSGDEFEITIIENEKGEQLANLKKLEPKELSQKQVDCIVNEVDQKLPPSESYDI